VTQPFFSKVFPSTIPAMCQTLEGAVAALVRRGWVDEADEFRLRLCLEEALTNAVKHGNCCDGSREVRLELAEEGGERCRIRVHDEGVGFCPDAFDVPPEDQIGGRGVCLMKHYMDEVAYNRDACCLEMTFRRPACLKGEPR